MRELFGKHLKKVILSRKGDKGGKKKADFITLSYYHRKFPSVFESSKKRTGYKSFKKLSYYARRAPWAGPEARLVYKRLSADDSKAIIIRVPYSTTNKEIQSMLEAFPGKLLWFKIIESSVLDRLVTKGVIDVGHYLCDFLSGHKAYLIECADYISHRDLVRDLLKLESDKDVPLKFTLGALKEKRTFVQLHPLSANESKLAREIYASSESWDSVLSEICATLLRPAYVIAQILEEILKK